MKKGNHYENKMGSIIEITSIKKDMIHITYNGKRKSPINKTEFQDLIANGHIWEV